MSAAKLLQTDYLFLTYFCRIPEGSQTQYWLMCQPYFSFLWRYISENWIVSPGIHGNVMSHMTQLYVLGIYYMMWCIHHLSFSSIVALYLLMPHGFLQECIHSTGIQWNGLGFRWIATEGTYISACKYKCVYINRLCSLSVSLSLSRYALPFLGQISHDTMIVAPYLTFLSVLKSFCLVLFSWGKMQKGWKKSLIRNTLYLISPQWEHFKT